MTTTVAEPETITTCERVRAIIATRPRTSCPVTITRNQWRGWDFTRDGRRARITADDTDVVVHLFQGYAVAAVARLTHLSACVVAHIVTDHLEGTACHDHG